MAPLKNLSPTASLRGAGNGRTQSAGARGGPRHPSAPSARPRHEPGVRSGSGALLMAACGDRLRPGRCWRSPRSPEPSRAPYRPVPSLRALEEAPGLALPLRALSRPEDPRACRSPLAVSGTFAVLIGTVLSRKLRAPGVFNERQLQRKLYFEYPENESDRFS